MTRNPDWRILTDSRDRLGESPQWNSATGEFFWIDFYGPAIRRLGRHGKRTDWTLPQFASIGSVVPCADGRLLIGVDSGLHFFDPRNGAVAFFADPNQGRPDLPYNDAKVDRHGNYWIGNFDATESAPRGIFYVLNRRGEWRIGDSGFVVCNGPTFSPKGDVLYFSDSLGRQSLAYDLDPATGALTRRRIFQKFTEADGLPDGCCVDAEGCVWLALYDGGKVLRLSPGGERLETWTLPARNITSCCLGGEDLRTLFVTSGQAADGSEPEGGAVFATEVEVPGLPEPLFRQP
ncbi:MAG TPA: SMP-30/gluconolactonase/LRE family protein [Dongiaceae bacterium]|nr:SMP-30/gluconolactonase/LRE family protein [Dongiaceae bacterium]